MISKNRKRIVTLGLAAMTMMAIPLTANAASYASANRGSNTVPVTVTYSGVSAKAMIPRSIEFTSRTGSYNVMAYCETDQLDTLDTNLSIVPSASFQLTKNGSSEQVTATVSQQKTVFTPSDVRAGSDNTVTATSSDGTSENVNVKQAVTSGTITVDDLTAGTWTGSMQFTVE